MVVTILLIQVLFLSLSLSFLFSLPLSLAKRHFVGVTLFRVFASYLFQFHLNLKIIFLKKCNSFLFVLFRKCRLSTVAIYKRNERNREKKNKTKRELKRQIEIVHLFLRKKDIIVKIFIHLFLYPQLD